MKRYHDPRQDRVTAKILPGEYYVTNVDETVTTVLGSCVSACIWDPLAGVGGMNHFMIPYASHRPGDDVDGFHQTARYGIFAMEFLINAILKHGGDRARLLVKIVGGGHVVQCSTSIGDDNVRFAQLYMARERLTVVGEHVGGFQPRKVIFHPLTGEARVLEIKPTETEKVARREQAYAATISHVAEAGDVEIF